MAEWHLFFFADIFCYRLKHHHECDRRKRTGARRDEKRSTGNRIRKPAARSRQPSFPGKTMEMCRKKIRSTQQGRITRKGMSTIEVSLRRRFDTSGKSITINFLN